MSSTSEPAREITPPEPAPAPAALVFLVRALKEAEEVKPGGGASLACSVSPLLPMWVVDIRDLVLPCSYNSCVSPKYLEQRETQRERERERERDSALSWGETVGGFIYGWIKRGV
jgi:hypothetical protein